MKANVSATAIKLAYTAYAEKASDTDKITEAAYAFVETCARYGVPELYAEETINALLNAQEEEAFRAGFRSGYKERARVIAHA